jgi:hypothetical protein
MRRITGVVIAALVLSGCGSKEPTGGSDTLKILTDDVDRAVAEKRTAKVDYTLEGAGQTLHGSGEVRFGANAAMNVSSIDQDGVEKSVLLIDGAAFFKEGTATDESVPWLKVDMVRDDPAGKSVAAAIKQLKALSEPAQFVKSMLGAGKMTGSDRDGDATHHTVDIDLTKLGSVPGFEDAAALLREAKADRFTMEIWTSPSNLINQMRTQVSCPAEANCVSTQDIYFTDWGTEVTLTAPPANQVKDYPR